MDLPAGLLHDLLEFTGTRHDNDALGPSLTQLIDAVHAAVPSYRGMRITIIANDQPIHLDAFLPSAHGTPIATSLRLPITTLGPTPPGDSSIAAGSHIILYATSPGAFVDLAVDLQYALHPPATSDRQPATHSPDQDAAIALDTDLPPTTQRSGLTGLEEASTINRAVGILIAEGHPPRQAIATLHQHAAAAGVPPHVYAARLLRRSPPDAYS